MAEFKTGWLKKAGERVLAWSHAKTCFYNRSNNITVYDKLQELDDKVDKEAGDIANTKISSFTASTASYPVPAANDTVKVGFGKIVKFFQDIRNWMSGVCLIGQIVNNCVTNNAGLPLSAAQGKALMDLYTVLNTKLSWEPIEVTNWAEHWFDIDIVAYKSKIGIFVSGILVPKMEIGQLTDINCFGFGSIPYGTNIAPATMVAGFQSADSESCTALISNIVEDRRFFRVRPMYRWTVGAAAGFSAFIPLL